jgi:hypothetical protein
MLQTGGCHFDKWIVPSERNHPEMRDLIDCVEYNPILANSKWIIDLSKWNTHLVMAHRDNKNLA